MITVAGFHSMGRSKRSATLFIEASTTSPSEITATLDCPRNQLFTQFQITNKTTIHKLLVHADTPEVMTHCDLVCPINKVPLIVKGHLHYLSNTAFRDTETSFNFHPAVSTSYFH